MTDLVARAPAYRAKMTEPVPVTTDAERRIALAAAGYNVFRLQSSQVTVDLLTDSGTGAMSAAQWSAMIAADEAYAGARSFERFRATIRDITGYEHVLPVHQGRAAERLLMRALVGPGDLVPGNGHFDTTRAHIEAAGAEAIDLPCEAALDLDQPHPWKGDVDLDELERVLESGRVPLVMVTLTANRIGGHPVSLDNLHEVALRCRAFRIPLFLDAARFAENAGLARQRDADLAELTPSEVARSYFDLADGCTMSAKKDGLANIGGFLALRDPALARKIEPQLVLDEGFVTYGGLAGRDLEAVAVGLQEALDPRYLAARLRSVRRLHAALEEIGVPLVRPAGGHAVYVDAGAWLPQVPASSFPGQALVVALYLVGGIRACEMGSLMFPDAGAQLVRLALPRRVYADEHLDYVADVFAEVARIRDRIGGFRIVEAPAALRHFTATLAPADSPEHDLGAAAE